MSRHCVCPAMLVLMALFVSEASARRWLSREHDRRRNSFFARYRRKGTKPEYYYTLVERPKRDQIEHWVYQSWVAAMLWRWSDEILAGPDVDQDLLPDLTIVKGGVHYDVELDRSEMSHKRMRERFAAYAGRESVLLIVTTGGDERMNNLLETAKESLPAEADEATGEETSVAFATTFARLEANPTGEVWKGTDGHWTGLET